MKNPIGKFCITSELIDSLGIDQLARLFSLIKFVPLKVTHLINDIYEYTGMSRMFRDIDTGELVPSYTITPYIEDAKIIEIKVEEIK